MILLIGVIDYIIVFTDTYERNDLSFLQNIHIISPRASQSINFATFYTHLRIIRISDTLSPKAGRGEWSDIHLLQI